MHETIAVDLTSPTDGLRDYLASRDVPCPACGYNLRGVQEPVCPECGGEVALSVTRAAGGKGWLWLLILALGWAFLACGMHTTRSVLIARDEARVLSGVQVLMASSLSVTTMGGPVVLGGSSPTGAGLPTPITISGPSTGTTATRSGSPVTITTTPQGSLTIRNATPTRVTGTNTFTIGRAAPGRTRLAWSQVRAETWVMMGISSALALGAAIVLLFVILRRRSIARAGPSRALLIAGLGIFAVYAAGQVFLFARDLGA